MHETLARINAIYKHDDEMVNERKKHFFWAASAALARASSEANRSSSFVIRLLPPSKQPKHNPMVSSLSLSPLSFCHPMLWSLSFSLFFFLFPLSPGLYASTICIFRLFFNCLPCPFSLEWMGMMVSKILY